VPPTNKVEIYQDHANEYRYRLLGENGEIVLPGEGHTRDEDAVRAFNDVVAIIISEDYEIVNPFATQTAGTEIEVDEDDDPEEEEAGEDDDE
jgi:uncharacterized protein YegP (UPF0339 family)